MEETKTLSQGEKIPKRRKLPVIDCDVHNTLASETLLYPYLSERWRRHHQMLGAPDRVGGYIPRGMPYGARYDAWTPLRSPSGFRFRLPAATVARFVGHRVWHPKLFDTCLRDAQSGIRCGIRTGSQRLADR